MWCFRFHWCWIRHFLCWIPTWSNPDIRVLMTKNCKKLIVEENICTAPQNMKLILTFFIFLWVILPSWIWVQSRSGSETLIKCVTGGFFVLPLLVATNITKFKNIEKYNTKNCHKALPHKYGFGNREKPIPDPGVKKAPNPGPQHCWPQCICEPWRHARAPESCRNWSRC